MKKILLILFSICISCKANIGYNKISNISIENVSKKQENDSLIGAWTILKTIEIKKTYKNRIKTTIERETVCNACPTIILKEKGEGLLKNPPTVNLLFNWEADKTNIFFFFSKKNDESLFFSLDKQFQYKISHDSNSIFLELIAPKGNYKYVLIRSLVSTINE